MRDTLPVSSGFLGFRLCLNVFGNIAGSRNDSILQCHPGPFVFVFFTASKGAHSGLDSRDDLVALVAFNRAPQRFADEI